MSLEGRYLDRAQRVAEKYGPLIGEEVEQLADDIVLLLREFVHHDMEWAALAVEDLVRKHTATRSDMAALAESLRARGCEP